MKYVVFSFGCRVNQYEGQAMIDRLIKKGHKATDKLEFADRYILNTCSVTREADKKSRQAVARCLSINPAAKVYICGCSSQNSSEPYKLKPNVVSMSGTRGKMAFLESIMSDIELGDAVSAPARVYENDLTPTLTKTRAYIKIQDGCDNYCSYCIVPHLRGQSRSRALESILEEAESLAQRTREIVLCGVNISAYGRDIGTSLVALVTALGKVKARKRFGSLECGVITAELLTAMKKSNFCDSFHLSLQSGSNEILKLMNRHYTRAEFLAKVRLIRKYFPDAGLTTDIIVGFPGESDQDFNDTVDLVIRARFMDMHIFPYSVRPGTIAASMTKVEGRVVRYRSAMLKLLRDKIHTAFLKEQYGKISYVYAEEKAGAYAEGLSSNNVRVYVKAPVGTFEKFALLEPYREGVLGEPVKDMI
ncbi:MAG: MiaB/RimO family radical SAM methylthiotransferase [Clostridiales bacterium]|jgi:threonylcarbamoyladenosine tRNA methylthiotransferase MtaB|nr:MiaB/RimO family radical SAM methylthiotransferase [Clostridiales bacterium]